MDAEISEEQRAWQMKARRFAQEVLRPASLARDRIDGPRDTFDWDIIRQGSQLGFRTAVVSKEFGGHAIDMVTQALVIAELAKGDSAMSKTFSQCWKWSHLVAASCTKEQKERFLKPFMEDDGFLLGKGGTEANAGSDNRMPPENDPKAGWKLRAERDGDDWILNGSKMFIANGSVAKLFFVDARTNPDVGIRQGTTMFIIPKDTPGFRIGKVFNKRGWRFYHNGELIFENCRVPNSSVMGEVNGGVKARANDKSEFGDIELAANALGICEDAVGMAMHFAKTYKRAGKYVIDHQLVQLKLNEMYMLTEALRSFVLRTAWERDRKLLDVGNNVLVMNYSQEVVQRVTKANMEIHGPEGCMMHARVDKLIRDALVWTHLAGDTVQRVKVVKRLPDMPLPM